MVWRGGGHYILLVILLVAPAGLVHRAVLVMLVVLTIVLYRQSDLAPGRAACVWTTTSLIRPRYCGTDAEGHEGERLPNRDWADIRDVADCFLVKPREREPWGAWRRPGIARRNLGAEHPVASVQREVQQPWLRSSTRF